MARTREFDEEKVVKALRDVFWEGGFDGTSYTDIMKATGLQKGSLYAAFGDKRSLYQVALNRYDQEDVSAGVAMLRDENLSPIERITILMDSTVEGTKSAQGRWGCLLCNAASEVAPTDNDVEKTVKASMDRIRNAIAFALMPIDKVEATESILASYFGARTLVKAGYNAATLKAVRDGVIQSLKT
jgi:TetR/AcrR family transcriptional repressor of nem operon